MRTNRGTPKGFKKTIRTNGPATYDFTKDHRPPKPPNNESNFEYFTNETMYDYVLDLEERRVYSDINVSLEFLRKEIRGRIHITKNEIFQIGELLFIAKKVCSKEKISFQSWISDNFDFSYETANNFMNVFKNCFGIKKFAYEIPVSILYQISKPNFPDELREYILKELDHKKLNNSTIKDVVEKYKNGGIDAVENDVEKVSQQGYLFRQAAYSLDILENALRTLEVFKTKIGEGVYLEGDENEKDLSQIGQIYKLIIDSLNDSIDIFEKSQKKAEEILGNQVADFTGLS